MFILLFFIVEYLRLFYQGIYLGLEELIKENMVIFNNSKNIDERFNSINLVIELMNRNIKYQPLLYKYIKKWMKYYILSTERKKFSYDDVVFTKVKTKILYLRTTDERLKLLSYFIHLLNLYNLNEDIYEYENFQKKLQLTLSLEKNNFGSAFLKLTTYNLFTLMIVLFISLFIFTTVFYYLKCNYHEFNIFSVSYIKIEYLNVFANIVAYLFNINKTLEFESIAVLASLIYIKIYFYIIISYFLVKEITRRIDKI